ncbi:DUF4158 domain-containing protein [Streptomyces sp. NBC_00624]|uniref:DUF4158 domain-containing protein n=1 Tax=Streptomyces sp. NBC_00624 TaxID=2975791 RepID=UPI00386DFF09
MSARWSYSPGHTTVPLLGRLARLRPKGTPAACSARRLWCAARAAVHGYGPARRTAAGSPRLMRICEIGQYCSSFPTRLLSATMAGAARFLEVESRFPESAKEMPMAAVEYVAQQVRVLAEAWAAYNWQSKAIQRHRGEIREAFGFRANTEEDHPVRAVCTSAITSSRWVVFVRSRGCSTTPGRCRRAWWRTWQRCCAGCGRPPDQLGPQQAAAADDQRRHICATVDRRRWRPSGPGAPPRESVRRAFASRRRSGVRRGAGVVGVQPMWVELRSILEWTGWSSAEMSMGQGRCKPGL